MTDSMAVVDLTLENLPTLVVLLVAAFAIAMVLIRAYILIRRPGAGRQRYAIALLVAGTAATIALFIYSPFMGIVAVGVAVIYLAVPSERVWK